MKRLPIRILENEIREKQYYIDYFGDASDYSKTLAEEIIIIKKAINNLELCES